MKPSKMRYNEAIEAARQHVYNGAEMPDHFDERQIRIYLTYVGKFEFKAQAVDCEMQALYSVYTKHQTNYPQSLEGTFIE